ncbi:MobA/MobL family protein [Cetobacterium ceti]|uniref:MobA/MobL family protein n=1 Tax=Cetobacterium ceti TaxID=180163 RepID=A0A1T4R8C3_9FUSO|nr:MobA/MobL family protein [Cetobacterium ceti]SKA12203.1 MobA/MobL family protein [Cetobacterium ceti]
MANYHLNMSYGKVGKTIPHFEYISATGKYTGKENEVVDEICNMPNWVNSPREFWEMADKNERINGRTYREIRIALPEELTNEENKELLNQFLKENFSNHYYSVVIHDKETQPEFDFVKKHQNIHAHIMFCPRVIDDIERKDPNKYFKKSNPKNPERGGAVKDPKWNEVEILLKLRKDWELLQNKHLEKHNIQERVSCESLSKQRQQALENGDIDKYNQLNRSPINIDRILLEKKELSDYEKELLKTHHLNREIKSIKDEIYFEMKRKRERTIKILNEFDSSISHGEKTTAFNDLLNKRTQIENNKMLLSHINNINIKNEVYSNLIPEYREKINELDSLIKEKESFTKEEFDLLAEKYNNIKFMESRIAKDDFDKEKENVLRNIASNIRKIEEENNKLNNEIQYIFANNSKNKEFLDSLEQCSKEIDTTKNINNIILATHNIESINKKLELIDKQLENSRKTTLNILSKKQYVPLEKEIHKLKEQLQSKEHLGEQKQAALLKEIIQKKEQELREIEIKCTKDMDKFIRIKESFEKKLHTNKAELNIKLQASKNIIKRNSEDLLLSTRDIKEHLKATVKNNKELLDVNKVKLDKLRTIKKSLNKDIKELEVLAYLSLTKGKYGELQDKFAKNMNRIEQIDIELIQLKENKFFNLIKIKRLEKEKEILQKDSAMLSKEFKELKASIPQEKLTEEIINTRNTLNEKEKTINEKINLILSENKELNSINSVCYELFEQYQAQEQKELPNKYLDVLSDNIPVIKNTGSWNLKLENDKEHVIRM